MLRLLAKQWRCNRLIDYRRSPCCGALLVFFFTYVQILFVVIVLFRNSPLDDGTVFANSDLSNVHYVKSTLKSQIDLNTSAVCSPDIFKYYYASRDYFPGEGQWVADDNSDYEVNTGTDPDDVRRSAIIVNVTKNARSILDRYVPDFCKFRFGGRRKPIPPDTVRNCFRRKHITSVATMGDSNGAHHYDAIVRLLNDSGSGNRCILIASETVDHTLLIPDVAYYARYDRQLTPLLHATYRHCSSCVSRIHRCRLDADHRKSIDLNDQSATTLERTDEVHVEHLSMVSVLDSSLKIDVPHNHFAVNLQYRADTYQVSWSGVCRQ